MAMKLYVGSLGKKLYVGNLDYGMTDKGLMKIFERHGTVKSAHVVLDSDTGRSRGFGFVEMKSDREAEAARAALSGQELGSRGTLANGVRTKPRSR